MDNSLAWQALQRIDESLGPDIGVASETVRDINSSVANLPGEVQAYVVDRNGNTLFSTDPAIKPMNITDRDYFSALAKGTVSADHATPLALLANEVVINALKYAFPDGRSGMISVSLKSLSDKRACLVIADDGVGFDKNSAVTGMGTRLIRGVVGQLRGEHIYERRNGTVFTAEIEIVESTQPDLSRLESPRPV